MARPSKSERTWSDSQLKEAVAASANWRHVMRALGLNANSAGAIRIVRRDVVRLEARTHPISGESAHGLTHNLGELSWMRNPGTNCLRRWDWRGVAGTGGHGLRLIRCVWGLTLRIWRTPSWTTPALPTVKPELRYLRDAASTIAASWFSLRGFNVALPVEPAVYDLLVTTPDGIKRVQVKTTTCYGKDGWTVKVGRMTVIGRQPGTGWFPTTPN